MKCVLVATGVLWWSLSVFGASGPEHRYLEIYGWLQEAEQLQRSGGGDLARTQFEKIRDSLKELKSTYPGWNEKVVNFRLRYVEERLQKSSPEPQPELASPGGDLPAAEVAAADPEVERLTAGIRQLQAEKSVLQAKLSEALAARPAAVEPAELRKAEERIKEMMKERDVLRLRLEKLEKEQPAAAEPQLESELAELRNQLEDAQALAEALKEEKALLLEQIEKLQGRDAEIAAIREENEQLRLRLAAVEDEPRPSQDQQENLRRAREMLAEVERERDALEARLQQRETRDVPETVELASPEVEQLEVLTAQVAELEARLAVFEAERVPYTSQELAWLSKPTLDPAASMKAEQERVPARQSTRPLPAAAGPVSAEAQRAFAAGRYGEAEGAYRRLLEFDRHNLVTLGNLAAALLEQDKLEEAAGVLQQAATLDPSDTHILYLKGILHFRQKAFDEAFGFLSRAAQMNPLDPQIQNYLGITLMQRGQRAAAETALRRAVQLAPGYASAHHNLAIVYAAQDPPFTELAKWHYEKARAGGHPKVPELEELIRSESE